MDQYAVLLRGINVGGNKRMGMADLRKALTGAGLENPRTILQSGNVVVGTNASRSALVDIVETTIETAFGFSSTVIVRSAEEMASITSRPHFTEEQLADGRFAHIGFCREAPSSDSFARLREAHDGPEEITLDGTEVYIFYPDGSGRSKLTNTAIERVLETPVTSRNWNTVGKIVALMDDG